MSHRQTLFLKAAEKLLVSELYLCNYQISTNIKVISFTSSQTKRAANCICMNEMIERLRS